MRTPEVPLESERIVDDDLATIGRAASHGCIRMRVPDVISLYNRVSVGTPVLIR